MYEVEAGAAVTTMMLEAVEMGLGTCWLGAIQRDEIKNFWSWMKILMLYICCGRLSETGKQNC